MSRIFLSYSRQDGSFTDKLHTELKRRGAEVWTDVKEIRIGDSISARIEDGLTRADYFCLILSKHSITRPWVQREYRAALTLQNRGTGRPTILPIVLENVELPVFLLDIRYADFSNGFASPLEDLCSAIGVPSSPAPFTPLLQILGNDTELALSRLEQWLNACEIEPLNNLWNAVRSAAVQLQSELQTHETAHTTCSDAHSVDELLRDSRRQRPILCALPPLRMEEAISMNPRETFAIRYNLRFAGMRELIGMLCRLRHQVETRQVFLVPESVSWTRHWEGLPEATIELSAFLRSPLNERGLTRRRLIRPRP